MELVLAFVSGMIVASIITLVLLGLRALDQEIKRKDEGYE